MSVMTLVVFWRCGRSLVGAIDKSLQQQQEQQQLPKSPAGDLVCDTQGCPQSPSSSGVKRSARGGNATLVAARRKVKRMVFLTTLIIVPSTGVGLLVVFSSHLAEAVLIMDALLTFLPLIWFSLNIQLHAGRSHERGAARTPASIGGLNSPGASVVLGCRNPFSRQQLVIPAEAPC